MRVLVVADSAYGNTWKLAGTIADAFGNHARALRTEQVQDADLVGLGLLIVGSPTQGGRPLPSVKAFLQRFDSRDLDGVATAAFDTRVDSKTQPLPLRLLVNLIGYAAPKIARELESRGGRLLATPEGFFVEGKEGPLRPGENERAVTWAQSLQKQLEQP